MAAALGIQGNVGNAAFKVSLEIYRIGSGD